MNNGIVDGRITELIKYCAPLGVIVKLRIIKDRYYLDFDGSARGTGFWENFWNSFDYYVTHSLEVTGFKNTRLIIKPNNYVTAFIGTLFSIIANVEKELENE